MSSSKLCAVALFLLMSACSAGPAKPTPIPAAVVRPQQPAPIFDNDAQSYRNATPAAPIFLPTAVSRIGSGATGGHAASRHTSPELDLLPTAMGIVQVRSGVFAAPVTTAERRALLEVGATVTVTGRDADGRWLALFTAAGIPGWAPASSFRLYGDADLTIVDSAVGPGPIATLISEALEPLPTLAAE